MVKVGNGLLSKLGLTALLLSIGSLSQADHDYVHETSGDVSRIMYGSCNRHTEEQPLWEFINSRKPDAWIWLGDVVYNDIRVVWTKFRPNTLENMKMHLDLQKQVEGYVKLAEELKEKNDNRLLGVWDDHDYGINDGDTRYPDKHKSQQLFLDFMDEPAVSERRQQEGLYSSQTWGRPGRRVKVILLDNRFFRDEKVAGHSDLLGEKQWDWLENELSTSDAQVHIIGSGIQVLPVRGVTETWAMHPTSKARLLDLLRITKPPGLLLISGDVHFAELLCVDLGGDNGVVVEATSSGLSHAWGSDPHWGRISQHLVVMALKLMPSRHELRAPKGIQFGLNFGQIDIDWLRNTITVQIIDEYNQTGLTQSFRFFPNRPAEPLHSGAEADRPKRAPLSLVQLEDGSVLQCREPDPESDVLHYYLCFVFMLTSFIIVVLLPTLGVLLLLRRALYFLFRPVGPPRKRE